MNFRIKLAKFLLRLSSFVQTLPVFVMKPDDLIEFSRLSYARPDDVDSWAEDELIDSGLCPEELDLLSDLPNNSGRLLLLGVGGGRDAIALAKKSFQVTGVDYVPEMVERAKQNAQTRGVQLGGLVQEISKLDVPPASFDIVWISRSMYSCIPTRQRRVEMVQRIAKALKPGGYFVCQFQHGKNVNYSEKGRFLRQAISKLTFGNREYEPGDILFLNVEFLHVFDSIELLCSEIEEGGLSVSRVQTGINPIRGGAICRKSEETL